MAKWLARFVLSLIPLTIIGLWVYGNYNLFFADPPKDSFAFWVAISALLVDFIVGIALLVGILVSSPTWFGWLWRKAELPSRERNRRRNRGM